MSMEIPAFAGMTRYLWVGIIAAGHKRNNLIPPGASTQ